MKDHKLGDLVLDFSIYPRKEVDRQHSSIIQEAIESGAVMPPLVVEAKTLRVVDGFHRHRAYKHISGDDPEFVVSCIEKKYRNEAELFLDAMRYNAEHGRALSKFDRTHCILVAAQLEVADADIAKVLHVPVASVQELVADRSAWGTNGKQKLVPIKRTIRHKAGQKLSKEQIACNAKLSGQDQAFYAHQLILLIENDLLNTADERLMERLRVLAGMLEKVLA